MDECESLRRAGLECGGLSTCHNGHDEFFCECAEGMTKQRLLCHDVDECEGVRCGGASTCRNDVGKFHCRCAEGWRFRGDDAECEGQCTVRVRVRGSVHG